MGEPMLQCQANARIHGWTAGWRSLMYVDCEEEAAFVAKEFMNSRVVIVSITASQLAIALISLMRMQIAALLTPAATVIKFVWITTLVQFCGRVASVWLSNQFLAARAFGAVSAIVTLSQWAVVIHVKRTTGYSIIDAYVVDADATSPSAAFFLVVGLVHIFLQGLVSAFAHGYCALRVILLGSLVMGLCGLYMFFPASGRILLTEIEFFAMFAAIVLSCVTLSLAQMHSRRVHLAQVACLAEELAKQRDRLQYDLSFAQKRAAGSLPRHAACSASALSSAVGELDAAFGLAGGSSCCGDSCAEDPPELYPLRSQYFQEGRGDGVTYLAAEDERARYELLASDAVLVDRTGAKLAQAGVQSGIYVLSSCGRLFANFDPDRVAHGFYHSSFLAGRPVVAAGSLTVRDGRLLSLSNESGHYIPAPSSLSTVLRRLTEMGVADLSSVRLEVVHNTAYEAVPGATCMVTASPAAARSRKKASPPRSPRRH